MCVRDQQLSSARSELTTVTQESEKQKRELEEVILELQSQMLANYICSHKISLTPPPSPHPPPHTHTYIHVQHISTN